MPRRPAIERDENSALRGLRYAFYAVAGDSIHELLKVYVHGERAMTYLQMTREALSVRRNDATDMVLC